MSNEQLSSKETGKWHVHVPTPEELRKGKGFNYSHDFKYRLARRIEAKLINQKYGTGSHPDKSKERVEPSKIHQLMHDPEWILESIADVANKYRSEYEYLEEVDYTEINFGPQTWVYDGCLDAVEHARREFNSVVAHGYRLGLTHEAIDKAINPTPEESS